jgi:hypothetical protein
MTPHTWVTTFGYVNAEAADAPGLLTAAGAA